MTKAKRAIATCNLNSDRRAGYTEKLEISGKQRHQTAERPESLMQYVVYCDESRHDGGPNCHFMAIGSLWVPRLRKVELTKEVRQLFRRLDLGSEVKWSKVSRQRIDAYKQIVDLFFSDPDLRFRVIVVDQKRFDPAFHNGDRELGFYRFYHELLVKWLEVGNEYLILLDFKQNQNAHHYHDLRTALTLRLQGNARILDLTVIDSQETPLAQVCDLLTGAIAAMWCDVFEAGTAKEELARHITRWRDVPSMTTASSSPQLSKFNVFQIELQ
jgi:hypothetical protein